MRKVCHMASGAVDREYDFNISGPVHLKSVDWSNKDHKRVVAASLVNGVYALELYRKKDIALAQLWWSSFRFKLVKELIDGCGSLYGAIYQFDHPSTLLPSGAPKYVIAFRGTIDVKDIILGSSLSRQSFHRKERSLSAMREVESFVLPNNGPTPIPNVWLAGHSLGSALAIQAGKNLAEKDVFLEAFLFNPPFLSLANEGILKSDILRNTMANKLIQDVKTGLTSIAATLLKSRDQLSKDEDHFIRLSRWKPHLFVNGKDHLSSGYITYFERREALGNTEAGRMEAKYTLRALMNNLVTLIDKDRDYVPLYLLPTAYLNTYARNDNFHEAHKIRQWWRENLQLKCTFYPYSA